MMARIPTRSRRQAMDWSLALISQGIESTIEHSEELGWALMVADEQHAQAEETIQRYRAENRHWPWRHRIQQHIVFDWAALAWVLLMAVFFWAQNYSSQVQSAGLMDSVAVSRGEWWRLFTAVCLHADIGHLAMNVTLGLLLLGLVMSRYGTGVGLLAAFLSGVGGNLATWMMFPEHRSLGASGMVMGCLGLMTVQGFTFRRDPYALKLAISGLCGGALLFVLLGVDPRSDVLAHFGGFATGAILGSLLLLVPKQLHKTGINVIAGAIFSIALIVAWWLALAG
jgi:Uncharacterized membrane protein (homolog of Drosophila rhomboid)